MHLLPKKDRKHKGCKEKLHLCQSKNIEDGIRADAEAANDVDFLGKIRTLDFVAKEVRYHHLCWIEYSNKTKFLTKSENPYDKEDGWHQTHKAHGEAFKSLLSFIEEIVMNEEVHTLDDLHRHYIAIYEEVYEGTDDNAFKKFLTHHLQRKILNFYGDKIKIENFSKYDSGKMVFSAKICLEQAGQMTMDPVQLARKKTRKIALLLRKEIQSAIKKPLPKNLKLKHIYDGELEVPKLVADFFQYLVVGPRYIKFIFACKIIFINKLLTL